MSSQRVIAVENLEDWFRQSIGGALERRQVTAEAHTEQYVVRLATEFARTEALYEYSHDSGYRLRPLAGMLAEAFETGSPERRQQLLQRL
ncbi:MAG TPA: hypothetical protein VJS89_07825, partial [Gammaproteobacteria bacterium]|nr:hypothetical protein [Gammaproteobacteria bacterium]